MKNSYILSCLSLALATPALAQNVPVANADFEAPGATFDNVIPGFVRNQGFATILDVGGVHHSVLDLNVYNNDPANPEPSVEQILGATYAAGTLSFTTDVSGAYNFQGYNGGLVVSLFDATTRSVVGSGVFTPVNSDWTTLAFQTTIDAGDSAIGHNIGLLFTHTGLGDVFVDNVSLNGPTGAVPEPASWALMVGGFGAVGGAMRFRRRTNIQFA